MLVRRQVIGRQVAEHIDVVPARSEFGVVDLAFLAPRGAADHHAFHLDITRGHDRPHQETVVPGEVRALQEHHVQAATEDRHEGTDLVVRGHELAFQRRDLERDLLLAVRLRDELEAGHLDDFGAFGHAHLGLRDRLAFHQQLDLDGSVSEPSGHQRAANFQPVLDEDGGSGGNVAHGDILRSLAGFLGSQPDGHCGNGLIAQAAGRDQRVESVVGGEVGKDHHPGNSLVALRLALLGIEHGGAQVGFAALGLGLLIEFRLTQVGIELIGPHFQVGPQPLGGFESLIESLRATAQRVWPRSSSPSVMLVLESSRKTSDAACRFFS